MKINRLIFVPTILICLHAWQAKSQFKGGDGRGDNHASINNVYLNGRQLVDQLIFRRILGVPYALYVYTTTGVSSFTPPQGVSSIDLLVVAGGGGGGGTAGGGGGAGGMISLSGLDVSSSIEYLVEIGDAGIAGIGNDIPGGQGGDSAFGSILAFGGGGGGAIGCYATDGGSGGGGSRSPLSSNQQTDGGTGVSGQGNKGGWGRKGNWIKRAGGGGGGAATQGGDASNNLPGNGGSGLSNDIFGEIQYYAGGGGGGGYSSFGTGGIGGGANGQRSPHTFSNDALPATGGGGGGGMTQRFGSSNGGNGGSGIVVVRFPWQQTTSVASNGYYTLEGVFGSILIEDSIDIAVDSLAEVLVLDSMSVCNGGYVGVVDQVSLDKLLGENSIPISIRDSSTFVVFPEVSLEMSTISAEISTYDSGTILLESGSAYVNTTLANPLLEIQQQETGDRGWRLIASPFESTFSRFPGSSFVTQGFSGSDFPALQPNLLWWDETDIGTPLQGWRTPAMSGEEITRGRGYFHYVFNGAGRPDVLSENYKDLLPLSLDITGRQVESADDGFDYSISYTPRDPSSEDPATDSIYYDINIADQGWNLVGNPTPSTIDWDDTEWIKTNMDNSIYLWDPSGNGGMGEYIVWNGLTGSKGDGLIAPFQGYWVKANNTGATLSFTGSAKSTSPGNWYKQEETSSLVDIPIQLSACKMRTQAHICLCESGVIGPDLYDAYQLSPPCENYLMLYSHSSLHGQAPLVINSLPLQIDQQMFIPLLLSIVSGSASGDQDCLLSWRVPENWPSSLSVELLDHQLKKAISMCRDTCYQFCYAVSETIKDVSSLAQLHLTDPLYCPQRTENLKVSQSLRFTIVIQPGDWGDDPVYQPTTAVLMNPYPNPFSSHVILSFKLAETARVRLDVFGSKGELLDTVLNGVFPAGLTQIKWSAKNPLNGICLFRLISGNIVQTKKGVIIH